jgi:hypothetical protein
MYWFLHLHKCKWTLDTYMDGWSVINFIMRFTLTWSLSPKPLTHTTLVYTLACPNIFTWVPQGVKEGIDSKHHVLGSGVARVRMILAWSNPVMQEYGWARRHNQWKPAFLKIKVRESKGTKIQGAWEECGRIGKVGQF